MLWKQVNVAFFRQEVQGMRSTVGITAEFQFAVLAALGPP